jgi:hypothetical protein
MGFTIEKGKAVIWTTKIFEADSWPFNDEGDNYTYFYKNLRDKDHFYKCLARLSDEEKKNLVSETLGMAMDKFILKSKKSHNNAKYKKQ